MHVHTKTSDARLQHFKESHDNISTESDWYGEQGDIQSYAKKINKIKIHPNRIRIQILKTKIASCKNTTKCKSPIWESIQL